MLATTLSRGLMNPKNLRALSSITRPLLKAKEEIPVSKKAEDSGDSSANLPDSSPAASSSPQAFSPLPTFPLSMMMSPFPRFGGLFDYMDDLWRNSSQMFAPMAASSSSAPSWQPRLDFQETDQDYRVIVDLPGAKKEGIEVELKGRYLHIAGKVEREKIHQGVRHHRSERMVGMLSRDLMLPDDADLDHVSASFNNGVLEVKVDKKASEKEAQQVRKIELA